MLGMESCWAEEGRPATRGPLADCSPRARRPGKAKDSSSSADSLREQLAEWAGKVPRRGWRRQARATSLEVDDLERIIYGRGVADGPSGGGAGSPDLAEPPETARRGARAPLGAPEHKHQTPTRVCGRRGDPIRTPTRMAFSTATTTARG